MATYKPLQSIVLTSAASSVTFSGIDQSYTDLRLVINYGITSGNSSAILQFNNDTTSAYSNTLIWAVTSGTTGGRNSSQTGIYLLQTIGQGSGQTFLAPSTVEINNYSNTTLNKTVLSRSGAVNNSSTYEVNANVGLWRNTAAITSITIVSQSSTFVAGSTFDLYGIKSGAPQAFGGDLVTTDGNYWYHTFKTSGTFTTLKPLSVDYLVVAGGGGGGRYKAGGGGGGGLRCTVGSTGGGGSLESPLSLNTGSSYVVTIGAGGSPGINAGGGAQNGTNGTDSVFGSITSLGGGFGGGAYSSSNSPGNSGGSGGGGNADALTAGGAGTTNQGFSGATAVSGQGGGGGGAGEAGNTDGSGEGGDGVATSISGSSTYYAGGGGGGGNFTEKAGGLGGGGAGGYANNAVAGTANTGGGGGGGAGDFGGEYAGRSGGSGIVIVRYPV